MNNIWLKIRIWTKIILVALVFIYAIIFTFENAQEKVQFWYWFHHQPMTNLLLLVLFSFLAGVVATILAGTTYRTIHQVRELRDRNRSDRLDRDIADMRNKAAMLQTKTAAPEKPPPPPIERLEDRSAP